MHEYTHEETYPRRDIHMEKIYIREDIYTGKTHGGIHIASIHIERYIQMNILKRGSNRCVRTMVEQGSKEQEIKEEKQYVISSKI